MNLAHSYETAIVSREGDLNARFFFIPKHSIEVDLDISDTDSLVSWFGLESYFRISEDRISEGIAVLFAAEKLANAGESLDIDSLSYWFNEDRRQELKPNLFNQYVLDFSRELVERDLVPFEASPLESLSIKEIVASKEGLGALIAISAVGFFPLALPNGSCWNRDCLCLSRHRKAPWKSLSKQVRWKQRSFAFKAQRESKNAD